jgi:hypothetical protein
LGWLGTPDSARARPARVGPICRQWKADERSTDCAVALDGMDAAAAAMNAKKNETRE